VEIVGHYNPITDPAEVRFNEERVLHWLRTGAQPTDTVQHLLKITGVWEKFTTDSSPSAASTN
jgi:small subunit ribosomal protein S16